MKLKLSLPQQQVVNTPNTYLNPQSNALGIFYFKGFYFLFFICLSLLSSSQTSLKVTDPKQQFGFVQRGEVVRCEYEIMNTGNEPLLLQEAEVSCSCTTVEFSKQPVLPGQKTTVLVLFNTKTVYGRQDRVVLLYSNAKGSPAKLRYKGTVSNK